MFGWIEGGLRWGGQKITTIVDGIVEKRLHQTGELVVQKARQLAPVKTGMLRESIDYIVIHNEGGGRSELRIVVGVPYGIFQEFGTRNIPPRPFIRPALLEAKRVWGFDINVQFAGVGYSAASGGKWHGLLAGTGRGHKTAGFSASASSGWNQLTSRQIAHVQSTLIPSIKSFHRGTVKKVGFTVGN